MGALDFLKEFEGRALDAASYQLLQRNYEMQEENSRLLRDKVQLLESKIKDYSTRLQHLTNENDALRSKVDNLTVEAEYDVFNAIALKRKSDGTFEETAYCPNCKIVMGNLMESTYQCSKCKHLTESNISPREIAKHLSSKK